MRLKDYLDKHGIEYGDFAERVGVERTAVWRWMKGANTPRLPTILRIQKETGGLVTVLDWAEPDSAPASPAAEVA